MANEFTAVAVTTQAREYTLEDIISIALTLRERQDNVNWEFGDLAIETTRLYGAEGVKELAKAANKPIGTIRRYRDVSKAYPKEFREEFAMLSWSSFRQVAGREDRFTILKRAHDENWTFEKLCAMTQPDTRKIVDDGLPVPAKPEMELCPNCRRWFIKDKSQLCPSNGQCPEIK